MQDFPANSAKAKVTEQPREKIEPVTSAETVRRKRGLGRQFKETFFGGSARDVPGHVLEEVIVPTIRDMFQEAMHSGIDRLFHGERTPGRPRSRSSLTSVSPGHINYSGISNPKPAQQRTISRLSRARHNFDELVIPTRQEAEEVIDRMFDVLSRDGMVSVAHLYALTGVQSAHTDIKWGWTALRGARAVKLRQGGFLLDLPEPEPLT